VTKRDERRWGRRSDNAFRKVKTAANGISVRRKWFKDYMNELGFTWHPAMKIGSGCTVHLREGELPMGRLVVNVSRHCVAVIDGVVHDTHDPTRGGSRAVHGHWKLREAICKPDGTYLTAAHPARQMLDKLLG
jgi:hypothetical protein